MKNLCTQFLRLTKAWLPAMLIVLLVGACSDDDDPGTGGDNTIDQLNQALTTLMEDAANGQGLAFYTMPASNDFASIPQDPNNPITSEKVELGKLLYHETGLLSEAKHSEAIGLSSCAGCHHAQAGFQAGLAQGIGDGGKGFGTKGEGRVPNFDLYSESELDVQPIRSPTAMNGAWQQVMLWNGQFGAVGPNVGTEAQWTDGTPKAVNELGFEGLETQAIAGLSVHRLEIDKSAMVDNTTYQDLFAQAFPGDEITIQNTGLAIAAYERTLLANESPFQKWLRGDKQAMGEQELRGAVVFFGTKANCVACHTGPALNSMSFHAIGVHDLAGGGVYGDAPDDATKFGRGGFTGNSADNYKFKTPQLYNLDDSRFYGHGASFQSIRAVVEYKNAAVAENTDVPTSQLAAEFSPLGLTDQEVDDLTAFLTTALYDANLARYLPSELPSGQCFPFNDEQARIDLGCN